MTSRRIKVLVPPPEAEPRGARAAAAAGFWIARALAWRPSRKLDLKANSPRDAAPPRLHCTDPRS